MKAKAKAKVKGRKKESKGRARDGQVEESTINSSHDYLHFGQWSKVKRVGASAMLEGIVLVMGHYFWAAVMRKRIVALSLRVMMMMPSYYILYKHRKVCVALHFEVRNLLFHSDLSIYPTFIPKC